MANAQSTVSVEQAKRFVEQMKTFPAQLDQLATIGDFVVSQAQAAHLDEAAIYSVQMAIDEACSNIIGHAYYGQDGGTITCTCQDRQNAFTIVLTDHGQAFDPGRVHEPDTTAPLDERPIGGLGLFFIRQLMDDVRFEFQPAKDDAPATNTLTMVKYKSASPASTYESLRRRADQLASVAEVSHAIISILDLNQLLETVVNLLSKRLNYRYVQIFSVHLGRRKIFYEAGNIPGNKSLQSQEFAYDLDDPHGIIPWVSRSGITVLANDVHNDPRYRLSEGIGSFDIRSELATPLIFGQEIHGVLDAQSDRPNAFGEDDHALLEALAGNIAIAMRNANLFRAEAWRRQVADGMSQVAGLLSADADLDQVLDAILHEMKKNLPCDAAAIWLLETPEGGGPSLELAAVYPPELDRRLDADPLSPGPWLDQAIHASESLTRQTESPYEPLGEALNFPPDYSAIATPLRIGEQNLGLMVLAHGTANRYGSETRAISASFASYAAVAIENTRLYEASHEQAWVATVLLQVADALQVGDDEQDILSDVAQIASLLIGVDACAFWLWEIHSEIFRPAAAHGLDADSPIPFAEWIVASGEYTNFDQARLEKRPTVLDPDIFSAFQRDPKAANLLFPLSAHSGETLGAMLACFTSIDEALRADNLAIIQGIAHQVATALENIRLLRSQREEAYVSVALLQVAQAIVSLNDLGDILDTITRIIPILAGVRRAAIFLCDVQSGQFQLAKSYGFFDVISAISPQDFPLLQAARDHNQLHYIPLTDAIRSPVAWQQSAPIPAQEGENAPNEAKESAQNENPYSAQMLSQPELLLLAFPLAVKGHILGILLVEEAPSRKESFPGAVRLRRLEIFTGITQQVALAIQNEQLQRDVVERERLERELQLARTIQQSFIPETLPVKAGWQIQAHWRTARQVGGDFYDVFELPGERLGIVIADVADKGMPAALYMTLVRTLLRAAVRESTSSGKVLERVNDLLIPDTHSGMFVTIVYAILDLANGELTYANAGHNPPLLLHQATGKISRMTRGGMALGILEGIQVIEKHVQMEAGDLLVLYTDGVTEAFSPKEEMFGEARLLKLLKKAHLDQQTNAQQIIENIEKAVDHFAQDESPSDDITIVTLSNSG